MANSDWVKAQFKVGDVIRNFKPYFGEPAYKLIAESKSGFIGMMTSSKYGTKTPVKKLILWSDFELEDGALPAFVLCSKITQLWLWGLGAVVQIYKNYKEGNQYGKTKRN